MLRISKAWRKRLAVRSPDPVLPERFLAARKRLRWTHDQAADFLWVTGRTIRNWEAGRIRIPYAAFRLLRLRAGHAVSAVGWDGWQFIASGGLVSPAGRVFYAYQLEHLERIFAQSDLWRKGIGLRVSTARSVSEDGAQRAVAPPSNTGGKSMTWENRVNMPENQHWRGFWGQWPAYSYNQMYVHCTYNALRGIPCLNL